MSPAKSTSKNKSVTKRRRRLAPETVLLVRQIVFGILLLLVLSALVSAVWYGTRADALTIDQVSVTGGETISHAAVTARVTALMQGTYFKLIPRQFAWLYPEQEIISEIYAFERVKSVQLERVSGKELHVELTEYIPVALWCNDKDSANCLFVDEVGYAFTAAPTLSGGTFVRYSTLGREPVRGEQVMEATDLAAVTWFTEALQDELDWSVVHIELDSAGDVFYILSDRSELKVALAADPSDVFANLITILESPDFDGLTPGMFQYIDLRFGNKVFVNREPWDDETMAAATSSALWDDVAATAARAVQSETETTATTNEERLTVPLIEESDEEVVIEPTPEVSELPPADTTTEDDEDIDDTATSTSAESE